MTLSALESSSRCTPSAESEAPKHKWFGQKAKQNKKEEAPGIVSQRYHLIQLLLHCLQPSLGNVYLKEYVHARYAAVSTQLNTNVCCAKEQGL